MKHIKQISEKMKLTMIREAGQPELSKADIDFINDLFRELKSCFPAWGVAIKSGAQQDETKRQWVQSFAENGINSSELVQRGMVRARKEPADFFPSPGRFVEWCKPPEHWEHRAQAMMHKGLPKLPATKEFNKDALNKAKEEMRRVAKEAEQLNKKG